MPKSVDNCVFVRFLPTPDHKVLRHQVEDIFSQVGPIKKSSWIHNNNNNNDDAVSSPPATTTKTSTLTTRSSKGYGFVKYVTKEDAIAASKELDNTKIQMDGQEYTLKVELASLSTTTTNNHPKNGRTKSRKDEDTSSSSSPYHSTLVIPNHNNNTHQPHVDNKDIIESTTTTSLLLKKKSRIIIRNLSFYAQEKHIRKVMEENYGKVLEVHLPKVQSNLHVGFCFVTFVDPNDAQKAVTQKHINIQKRTVNMDWSLPKNVHQQQQQKQEQQQKQQKLKRQQPESTTTDVENDNDDDENNETKKRKTIDAEVSDEGSSDNASSQDEDENGEEEHDDDDDDDGEDSTTNVDEEESNTSPNNEDDASGMADDSISQKCSLFVRNLPFDATRHDLFQLFSKYGHIKAIYLVKDKDTGMLKGTAFVTYSKSSSAQRAMDAAATAAATSTMIPQADATLFVSQRHQAASVSASSSLVSPTTTTTASSSSEEISLTKGSLLLKGRKILVDFAVDKETAATFDAHKEHQSSSADRRNLYLQTESRVESSTSASTSTSSTKHDHQNKNNARNDANNNNNNTWDDLPPQDQKKRQAALRDKTTKLQSPIFFINPHRLSIRNLAKHVDEALLQQLCAIAVQRALQKRLVSVKDQIAHWKAAGNMTTREILAKVQTMESSKSSSTNDEENVIPKWDDSINIKEYLPSVFIDRDFGGPTGQKKKKQDAPSRGFGFVEFRHHVHALACLRELNNNPSYSREYVAGGKVADAMKKKRPTRKLRKKSGSSSGSSAGGGSTSENDYIDEGGRVRIPRLIVDFTVENKIKAKKQAERRIQQQLNQEKQKSETVAMKRSSCSNSSSSSRQTAVGDTDGGHEKKKRRSRGAKQREKKRQKRESGEEEAERQAELQAKVIAEAKLKLRKERLEQKRKAKEEMKCKLVKPPKKKPKRAIFDDEDEKFETIVRSYTSKLESTAGEEKQEAPHNDRGSFQQQQQRWFD